MLSLDCEPPTNSCREHDTLSGEMIWGHFKSVGLKQDSMKHMLQLPFLVRKLALNPRLQIQLLSSSTPPPLPVPPLQQTLDKYLRSVTPFVTDAELERTKKAVKSFVKDGVGPQLQDLLEQRAKSTDNWMKEWWLETAYLGYRDPVVIFSSPGMVWPSAFFRSIDDQLIFASHLIVSTLEYNEKIEKGLIPPEKRGSEPLCMVQYNRIFGTNRVPKKPSDYLRLPDMKYTTRNILVIYNNFLFDLDVFEKESRKPLGVSVIYSMLRDVVEQGSGKPAMPIGILTAENRDNWADAYEELKKDENNRKMLEEQIEKALFVVCIDKPLTVGKELHPLTRSARLVLHGFGGSRNGGNRWFDKTVQFVIGAASDGVGVSYEHSPAEGGPIGVLTDYVYSRLKESPLEIEPASSYPKPNKLELSISVTVADAISAAIQKLDKMNDELEVIGYNFAYFGKNRMKAAKISPDSFIQIAIQYAFYKTHQHPAAQYESGTLRKFTEGRTDVIRTCSQEVVNFCRIMSETKVSSKEKYEALMKAVKSHKQYALDVLNGAGVDRHFLGLRNIARENNIKEPEIFRDVAYKKSSHFILSTSNVPAKCDSFMVYGPLVQDGYACCYNPRGDNINFGTSTWRTCPTTNLNNFVSNLEAALLEMESHIPPQAVPSKL